MEKTFNELHIYVIAFNNEVVIELLITKLKEFLDNSFTIVVFDNSNDFKKRPLIKNSCKKFDVNYFSLPKQPKEFLLSESHGLALNYVYRNFVQKVKPLFFGFLDHDVFPFQNVNIVEILKIQEFYGIRNFATHEGNISVLSSRTPEYWYLWPGFCFFKFSFISKFKKISFMPLCENNLSFDTGGFLYKRIFKSMNISSINFPNVMRTQSYNGGHIDIIDDKWVHTISGSNWRKLNLESNYEIKVINSILK